MQNYPTGLLETRQQSEYLLYTYNKTTYSRNNYSLLLFSLSLIDLKMPDRITLNDILQFLFYKLIHKAREQFWDM